MLLEVVIRQLQGVKHYYIGIRINANLLHLNSEMFIKYPLNCFAIDMHGYCKLRKGGAIRIAVACILIS